MIVDDIVRWAKVGVGIFCRSLWGCWFWFVFQIYEDDGVVVLVNQTVPLFTTAAFVESSPGQR